MVSSCTAPDSKGGESETELVVSSTAQGPAKNAIKIDVLLIPADSDSTVRGRLKFETCVGGLHDLLCYGFVKVFESQLLTETFRGSAQARPKQALHVTSNYYPACAHAQQGVKQSVCLLSVVCCLSAQKSANLNI